jgi:hypothetical protein
LGIITPLPFFKIVGLTINCWSNGVGHGGCVVEQSFSFRISRIVKLYLYFKYKL